MGRGNEERAPHQALELDAEGGDVELCRGRTVWNRHKHHGSAWGPECWPRPWPEHDTEHAYRFGGDETFDCLKSEMMQAQWAR